MRKCHSKIREQLLEYGEKNKSKVPALSNLLYKDELAPLQWKHGVRCFPPHKKFIIRAQIHSVECETNVPFLWVALRCRIKIVHEKTKSARILTLKKAKHTNLTGGQKAYTGGELWFVGQNAVVVNFSSGRYGPKSENELNSLAKLLNVCLKKTHWTAKILGWDKDINRPIKYPR